MITEMLLSPSADLQLLQTWFEQLSERDKVIATLSAVEFASERVRELQANYSVLRSAMPPCTHCGDASHGIYHCPDRRQYTGLSREQMIANYYAGVMPNIKPREENNEHE